MIQTGKQKILAFSTTTVVLIALLLCSCSEDVITVDLNTAEPHIVIEGVITDEPGPYVINISKTTDFFRPGELAPVSGATVVISDNNDYSETLTEIESGQYHTSGLQGTPGHVYTLSISAEEKEYIATSTMHAPTSVDSLSLEIDSDTAQGNMLHFYFQDTEDLEEYYRFKVLINNEYYDYFALKDRLTDGKYIHIEFYIHDDDINNGDIITLETHSIDASLYEYFNTLKVAVAQNTGGIDGALFGGTPANPISNISNDALGYFGAVAIRSFSVTVEK